MYLGFVIFAVFLKQVSAAKMSIFGEQSNPFSKTLVCEFHCTFLEKKIQSFLFHSVSLIKEETVQ